MKWAPTSVRQLISAELALLKHTIRGSACRSSHIPLASGEYINTLEAWSPQHSAGPPQAPTAPVVLAHGFGSGLGLWGPTVDALIQQAPARRVVAFDWLGMGGSSRPEFTKRRGCHPDEVVDESEAFFCDSMLEWADRMGLERFELVGHSLGGYLSAVFALRHPDRVSRLVLVSPVGIPTPGKGQRGTGGAPGAAVDSSTLQEPHEDKPQDDADKAGSVGIAADVWRQLPWQLRMIIRAWNYNVTPQGLVRLLGTFGPRVMSAAVSRRFGGSVGDPITARLVAEYLYHVTASEGSGEYAMNALLAPQVVDGRPSVYARRPLASRCRELAMPTQVLFGDNDWMAHPDVPGLLAEIDNVGYVQVPKAGHHIYLDNPGVFHAVLGDA